MTVNLGGRPEIYSDEVADLFCELLATHGIGVQKICDLDDRLPANKSTIFRWIYHNHNGFRDRYVKAKDAQVLLDLENRKEILARAAENIFVDDKGMAKIDGGIVGLANLELSNARWDAERRLSKLYGQKISDDSEQQKAPLVVHITRAKKEVE